MVTLQESRAEYLGHLRARNQAEATLRSAATATSQFIESTGDIKMKNVNGRHVDAFFTRHSTWRARTINARLAVLRRWWKWAATRNYVRADRDPTITWRTVTPEPDTLTRVKVDEFDTLFDACDNLYHEAILAVGLYTFMRASEMATLRVSDLDFTQARIHVVRHKTKDVDLLPMSGELEQVLRAYLTWYSARATVTPGAYLFPVRSNPTLDDEGALTWVECDLDPHRNLSAKYITRQVSHILRKAGLVERHIGAHTLRRSGATALYHSLVERGVPDAMEVVSSMLGHKSITTTERYLGTNFARRRRDDAVRGWMFPERHVDSGNVVPLRREA